MELPFRLRKLLRRIGILLMVVFVLASSVLGWVLERASDAVHFLVRILGLSRVEDWLRRQHVWVAFAIMGVMVAIFVLFKSYELGLLVQKQFVRAFSYGLVFKVLWFGVVNYLLHMFGEQFLAFRIIRFGYDHYVRMRALVREYLERSAIYRKARQIKARILAFAKKRSILHVARRFMRKKEE